MERGDTGKKGEGGGGVKGGEWLRGFRVMRKRIVRRRLWREKRKKRSQVYA